MALRLSTVHVTWALLSLWLAAVGVTGWMLLSDGHAMGPLHFAPAAVMTALVAAWPFALGWRPLTPRARRLRTCSACGTQWRPAEEGTAKCPACGA